MVSNPPNILWICTDQQRHDTIGALGNPHIRTPALDRLVAEGVAFTSAYCQTPICTPSRASFLTGRYPSHLGVNSNSNIRFPDDAQLVTRTLADAGYDCGMAGKLHLSTVTGRVEPRPDDGYRVFRWSHHPRPETYWGVQHHAYHQWLEAAGRELVRLLSETTLGEERCTRRWAPALRPDSTRQPGARTNP